MNEDVKAALDEAQSLGFKLAWQRDAAWVRIEKLERELAEYRRHEPMRRGLDAVVNLERGTLRFENGWLVEMNTLGYDFGYDQAPVAIASNDFGRDDPNAKPPGEHEPCDLCAHPLGDHVLVEGSGPRYYDRPCDRASCDCENFKRWTGAQSGTAAPPPQSPGGDGGGLGFSPTEPLLRVPGPERSASTLSCKFCGPLEDAIRHHLYVCPLPSANLRKAIGYKPGVELVRPCSLPFASIEDAGGPDPSPFDSDWNGKCQCGHLHSEHGPSSSINFTAGACQWSEARTDTLSEKCSCKHFIHEGTASAAP